MSEPRHGVAQPKKHKSFYKAAKINPSLRPLTKELLWLIANDPRSDEELAETAGWARTLPTHWRNGNSSPSLLAFEDIASVLGYDVKLVKREDA